MDTGPTIAPAMRPAAQAVGESRDAQFVALLRSFRRSGGLARETEILDRRRARRSSGRQGDGCSGATIRFEWGGSFWLPWFQFDRNDLSRRRGPAKVIDELALVFDGWDMAVWFAQPNLWIGDARPIDLIDACLASVFGAARADRSIAAAARPLRVIQSENAGRSSCPPMQTSRRDLSFPPFPAPQGGRETMTPTQNRSTPVVYVSDISQEATLGRLVAVIEGAGMRIFARIDHAAGAREVGIAMPPSVVLIYGHPKGGTPIMLAEPAAALELPLRVLVREGDDGRATVSFHPIVPLLREAGVADELAMRLEPAQQVLLKALGS